MGGLRYHIMAHDTTSGRGSFPMEHSRRFGGETVSVRCDSVNIRQRDVTKIARFIQEGYVDEEIFHKMWFAQRSFSNGWSVDIKTLKVKGRRNFGVTFMLHYLMKN